ncbi:MAG: ankyrin repeat domain-containing protein [Acidobacteria bacterium]|nr:ankyrin repeat domain-containing protein [Acidobacteriota bacterium]
MPKNGFIDNVSVGSPCTADWDKMVGSEMVRTCEHCSKDVNNLSEMNRKDAKRLVRASDGNICIRYMKHPVTKRPVFAGQMYQITRRVPGIAAGVMTASLSLSTAAYAQSEGVVTGVPHVSRGPLEISTLVKPQNSETAATGRISGTILDPHGAVIQNAVVSVINVATNIDHKLTTNDEGQYTLSGLAPGNYRIESTAAGFAESSAEIAVTADSETNTDLTLEIKLEATVEIIADTSITTDSWGGVIAVSRDYATALARAVDSEEIDEVRELISKGENVNGKDKNYDDLTPLFIAVENGSLEIAEMLIDSGAKLNVRDRNKQTALMRLDADARPELIDLLVRHGVKLNLSDNDGNTALILASGGVSTEVLRALIDAGADVNLANKEGKTPLMRAAEAGHLENVRLLLESGANVNARDKEGENAWYYAEEDAVEQLLVSYGSEVMPDEPETDPNDDSKQVISRR